MDKNEAREIALILTDEGTKNLCNDNVYTIDADLVHKDFKGARRLTIADTKDTKFVFRVHRNGTFSVAMYEKLNWLRKKLAYATYWIPGAENAPATFQVQHAARF